MKTIKFFTILITPLIAGIACCMIILDFQRFDTTI